MSQDKGSNDAKLSSEEHVTSAFFDEELAEHESIEAWLADDETAQRWHRYSVISSVFKKDLSASVSIDISEQVSAAVAAEQQPSQNVLSVNSTSRSSAARKAASKWFQPLGKVAVAAGVAVVAVMTVQTYQQPDTMPSADEPTLMTNPLGGRQPVSYSPSANSSPMSAQQQQQQDLQLRRQAQSYLIDHQQQILLLQSADTTAQEESQPAQQQDKQPQR